MSVLFGLGCSTHMEPKSPDRNGLLQSFLPPTETVPIYSASELSKPIEHAQKQV
jgi:hypothetical protein